MKIASISETSWPEELKTLRWALELWMLDFLMGHQLLTPEDDKAMIEGLLNQRLGDGPVSFRLPNKIFKMQLVPIIKELAHSTVQGLLNILERSEKTSDWSYAFCTMILLLTVAAEIEIALADFLACAPADRDPSRLRHDVEKVTEHLDKDLMEFFIGLFNVKFNPRRDGFNPVRCMREGRDVSIDDATVYLLLRVSDVVAVHRKLFSDIPARISLTKHQRPVCSLIRKPIQWAITIITAFIYPAFCPIFSDSFSRSNAVL